MTGRALSVATRPKRNAGRSLVDHAPKPFTTPRPAADSAFGLRLHTRAFSRGETARARRDLASSLSARVTMSSFDEESIVIDAGSASVKVGYSGELALKGVNLTWGRMEPALPPRGLSGSQKLVLSPTSAAGSSRSG